MMPESYADHVIDHFEDPYHAGACERPTHRLRRDNPMCGDWSQIELAVDCQGTIREAWFDGQGCMVSQAAASLLVERIEGMRLEEAKRFSAAAMLQLFGPGLAPARQKCCLLPWRALQGAIDCPLAYDDQDDLGSQFGGPSLDEES